MDAEVVEELVPGNWYPLPLRLYGLGTVLPDDPCPPEPELLGRDSCIRVEDVLSAVDEALVEVMCVVLFLWLAG